MRHATGMGGVQGHSGQQPVLWQSSCLIKLLRSGWHCYAHGSLCLQDSRLHGVTMQKMDVMVMSATKATIGFHVGYGCSKCVRPHLCTIAARPCLPVSFRMQGFHAGSQGCGASRVA
jgi:hypothetical protein